MSWSKRKVSELCILAVDCVNKTAPTVEEPTDFKMIRTTNIKGGYINTDDVRYVTEEVFERWTRRSRPQYGDVILTREAPVGQVGRFTSEDNGIFLGQRLFHYRPNPELLDWNYLAYALMSHEVQGRLKGMGFGAIVDHIRVGDAENLEIPCPPIEVQKQIGDVLSAYDDLIENNRRRIQLLEESARLLYKEWFVRLRFPGHEHVKVVDGVPEGWEKKTAWDVMEVLSGGTPKTKIPEYWNGGIPFFTPKDATSYAYSYETEKNISEEGLRNCNSRLYPKDTVFITARGTVGKINLAQTAMAMNQSCYALVSKEPLNQHFLYYALVEGVEQFRSRAVGAVFDAVIRDTFKLIPFLVPTVFLIDAFTDYASPILKQIDILSTQNRSLTQARDFLLPRLMNGEVAV
jgi:type I restriction enzyme S subunit